MKVYRIYNFRVNCFVTSRNNQEGFYSERSSAVRALAQYPRIKNRCVIKEYELQEITENE